MYKQSNMSRGVMQNPSDPRGKSYNQAPQPYIQNN